MWCNQYTKCLYKYFYVKKQVKSCFLMYKLIFYLKNDILESHLYSRSNFCRELPIHYCNICVQQMEHFFMMHITPTSLNSKSADNAIQSKYTCTLYIHGIILMFISRFVVTEDWDN